MHTSPQVITRTAFALVAIVGFVLALSVMVPRPASALTPAEQVDTNITD
jgi:hypothetical protein